MTNPKSAPPKKKRMTREEEANEQVGSTDISRGLAWLITLAFLGMIISVPTIQWVKHRGQGNLNSFRFDQVKTAWNMNAVVGGIDYAKKRNTEYGTGKHPAPFHKRVLSANAQLLKNIQGFEDKQKENSFLFSSLVTPMQAFTADKLGLGNEKAWPGKGNWSFFRPGIQYLTGPGFLETSTLERKAKQGNEFQGPPQADPRLAIKEFHDVLKAKGIKLCILPAPVKPQIYPEELAGRFKANEQALQNHSFEQFVADVAELGVTVIDPAPRLFAGKSDSKTYLETDTHWSPEGMEIAATQCAEVLKPIVGGDSIGFSEVEIAVTNLGDIAANTLTLSNYNVYLPETVTIRQVTAADGSLWQATPNSPVLFLGDSFSNIFSDDTTLRWGSAAGFAERLSFKLKQPVDAIRLNDNGAFATRAELRSLLGREDRLKGVKVVVWEFAARELSHGDWKLLDWSKISSAPVKKPKQEIKDLKITGTIEQIAYPPDPNKVNYADSVSEIHLTQVGGLEGEEAILLRVWGMRAKKHTEVAKWKVGETREFTINPWRTSNAKTAMRQDLDDPDDILFDLPIYWSE